MGDSPPTRLLFTTLDSLLSSPKLACGLLDRSVDESRTATGTGKHVPRSLYIDLEPNGLYTRRVDTIIVYSPIISSHRRGEDGQVPLPLPP